MTNEIGDLPRRWTGWGIAFADGLAGPAGLAGLGSLPEAGYAWMRWDGTGWDARDARE
jgi:hypothetical protein